MVLEWAGQIDEVFAPQLFFNDFKTVFFQKKERLPGKEGVVVAGGGVDGFFAVGEFVGHPERKR